MHLKLEKQLFIQQYYLSLISLTMLHIVIDFIYLLSSIKRRELKGNSSMAAHL